MSMVYEPFKFTEGLKHPHPPFFFLPVFQVRTGRLLCYVYYCLNTKHLSLLLRTQQISHYEGSVNLEEYHPVDSTSSLQNTQRNIVFLGFLF
jgi:hypothetical protein